MGVDLIFSKAFGNWLFPFLICTSAITYTLSKTQFIRRFVFFLISRRFAQKSSWNFIIILFVSICILGLFMEPTVLFIMFLPVMESIFDELGLRKEDKATKMIMLGLIVICGVSSGMTPIAHTFPLVAMAFYERDTGISIDWLSYSAFGIIVGVIVLVLMMLVFRFLLRPDLSMIKTLNSEGLRRELTPADRKERVTLAVFILVIVFWLLPSVTNELFPDFAALLAGVGNALPPMVGLIALSILTDKGKPILDFVDSMKNGVPWAGVFMACSVIALGSILTREEVGLTGYLTSAFVPAIQGLSPWLFLLFVVAWAVLQTNFSSDMVTLTMVYAVAIPLTMASGQWNPAAIACVLGISVCFAFSSPAATTYVSIAVGTPWIQMTDLLKYGLIMAVLSIAVLLVIGVPVLNLLFPT
jgi:sodium-dependent dicarboxylate transporter 2/3/5